MKHFRSLKSCLNHIRSTYNPKETVALDTFVDIHSGNQVRTDAPAYLFRGESIDYSTTTSSMHRMKNCKALPPEVKNTIEQVSINVNMELQRCLELDPNLSAGFLQHYGMPTELLDLSSDLDVAAYFASGGGIGNTGLICVVPLSTASRNSIVVDLRYHPRAVRPRRQSAFALKHRRHIDIKDNDCISELELVWLSFELQEQDILRSREKQHHLLDAHTDKFAGIIQLIMNSILKIDDHAAKWLSDKIVPGPVLGKKIDLQADSRDSRTFTLVPRSSESFEIDEGERKRRREEEENARYKNYTIWSEKIAETEPHRLVDRLGEILRQLFLSEEVLFRLAPNWPAGTAIDYLVPAAKLAFTYQQSHVDADLEAEEWCGQNDYRLIRVVGADAVTVASLRMSLLQNS